MPTTASIADYVLGTDYDELSDEVTEAIKKRILDSVAIASGAIGETPVEILRETVHELDEDGDVSIWGSNRTTSPPLATALNGGMVRYLDFMDAYLLPGEVPHPSNNVAPAVVAGEYVDATGRDLIEAIGIAYEFHYQLGKHAPLMDRGWDHGTYVAFTAAAAAGSMFGLDRESLRHGLGIAGVGHNALRVTRSGDISMWKGLSASNAARNAVYAVMLANNGMHGPVDVLEGQSGWKEVVAGEFDFELAGCDAVLETMTKKYMAGTVAQTALDALDELLERHDIDGSAVESIDVETYHRAKVIMGGTGEPGEAGDRHVVTNREEADHSIPYTMAVLALDGALGKDQYRLDRIREDDVQGLLRRVTVEEDPALTARYEDGEMPANVRVTMADASTFELERPYFEGHPARPMTWEGLEAKFDALADQVYPEEQRSRIVETIKRLERHDVADLVGALKRSP